MRGRMDAVERGLEALATCGAPNKRSMANRLRRHTMDAVERGEAGGCDF